MNTLIHSDNIWALWAILISVAALSIWLEQRFRWAARITGCVLALIGMMVLANLGVVPTESVVYDTVWDYIVPLAIPLLLFQCNIKRIGRESGRLLLIFLIGSVGTIVGGFTGFFLLRGFFPELYKVAAMFTGTYIGGSVNFVAMADTFGASSQMSSQAVVADNLLMALYFFVLISIPAIPFFRKHYTHPLVDEVEAGNGEHAKEFWKPRPISLQNISFDLAAAFLIVAISTAVANFFAQLLPTEGAGFILNQLLGNKYLIMTTLTMLCATFFPKTFNDAPGANEIGTFMIHIFFAVIGAPASIISILTQAPILLVYALIIVGVNMLFSLVFGKIFHFSLEEIILASNANIGGPTTATAMAISKGWNQLIGPVMLVGVLGYVVGNYLGILTGTILGGI